MMLSLYFRQLLCGFELWRMVLFSLINKTPVMGKHLLDVGAAY